MRARPELQVRQIVWLLICAPTMNSLLDGQIYFIMLFLAAMALLLFERNRATEAAIAIGLIVAIKPTLAFWPFFLYFANYRRLALRSMATAAVASALPLAFYGPRVYAEWLNALDVDTHWLLPTNVAIPAIFTRFGARPLGFLVALALTAVITRRVAKTRPSFAAVSGIALCAGILCAPMAWSDYCIFLAPFFISRRWNSFATVAAALMTIPAGVVMMLAGRPGHAGLLLASMVEFVAVCMILAGFLRNRAGSSAASHCENLIIFPGPEQRRWWSA
jgi:hypothetical protein